MRSWIQSFKTKLSRRLIVPALAVLTAASLGAYEIAKPVSAAMAAPAPSPAAAAPALDENSVEALLALDRAMESLAARVTPAIVNVTVTSKANARMENGDEDSQDQQQF